MSDLHDSQSLRRRVIAWFVLVIGLVSTAAGIGWWRVYEAMHSRATSEAQRAVDLVRTQLESADTVYASMTRACVSVLEAEALALGAPSLGAQVTLTNRSVPELRFGNEVINERYELVDKVVARLGGTATFFVKSGDEFVRVSTNVKKADGTRAIGTILDPQGPAIAEVRKGLAFTGLVQILGRSYYTHYKPISDAQGSTIGVYYAGYPIETLEQLARALRDVRVLEHGYVALCNANSEVLYHSSNMDDNARQALPVELRKDQGALFTMGEHEVQVVPYAQWQFRIVTSLYRPDLRARTFLLVRESLGILLVVLLVVLLVSWKLAGRLADALELARRSHTLAEEARAQADDARLRAEEARVVAEQASRTKSAFLANMSHELRTPMNAIIGYSEMLDEELEEMEPDEARADLKKIHAAGKHLLSLINDVLDLSKIEAGRMTLYLEEFEVSQLVEDVLATIQPLIAKNGNRLEVRGLQGAGRMRADLTKTRQTLLNLLSNASKFTDQGLIELVVEADETSVRWQVRDSGIGMTDEQMSRLFEAFVQADSSTTRKFGGTGLGLAISRRFVRMMGGEIRVSSQLGQGSVFTIELPRQVVDTEAPPVVQVATQTTPSAQIAGHARILVVDDDPHARELVRRNLTREGFEVLEAADGASGIARAKELKPDVILLDVMMPGRDGWSTLAALKADPDLAHTPVIMSTMLENRELSFAMGAADYMRKPVDWSRLEVMIRRHSPAETRPVLVVEDDPASREMLVRLVQKAGHTAIEARDGREALEILAKQRPQLVLLDLMMPHVDGFDFVERLRSSELGAGIPVLVVTAKSLTPDDIERLTGKVDDVLRKGAFRADELVSRIRSLVTPVK